MVYGECAQVVFKLAANVGEPLLPLANVASGGESSRIMLGKKLVGGGAISHHQEFRKEKERLLDHVLQRTKESMFILNSAHGCHKKGHAKE